MVVLNIGAEAVEPNSASAIQTGTVRSNHRLIEMVFVVGGQSVDSSPPSGLPVGTLSA